MNSFEELSEKRGSKTGPKGVVLKLGSHLRPDVDRRQSEGEQLLYVSHAVSKYLMMGYVSFRALQLECKKYMVMNFHVSLRLEVVCRFLFMASDHGFFHYCSPNIHALL